MATEGGDVVKRILIVFSITIFVLTSCSGNRTERTQSSSVSEDTAGRTTEQITEQITASGDDISTHDQPHSSSSTDDTPTDGKFVSKAVWWWNAGSVVTQSDREKYFTFLHENGVNELYFCQGTYNAATLDKMFASAEKYGMRVSYLTGDASWILEGNVGLEKAIERFLEYQNTREKGSGFYGMHLDIEPHQLEDFFENRPYYIQRYCDTVLKASNRIHEEGYELEIDIPFWFDSDRDTVINEKGESENVISVLSRYVDTLCIMSYRDSAEDILQISSEEIAFARLSGCRVVCGVDTYSLEGDHVSFKEEGKEVMNKELEKLLELLEDEEISGYGVAIHYLDTWYNLKDL